MEGVIEEGMAGNNQGKITEKAGEGRKYTLHCDENFN